MNAVLHFLPLFARQKRRIVGALLLSLLTVAAGIGLLGLSGWFLTAASISNAGTAFNLFAPSAGVRGLFFLRILSRYGEKLVGHDATLRLLSDIRRWLFGRLFPVVPFRGRALGRADLVSRLTADVDALDTAFLFAIGPITTAVLVGIAMSVGLLAVLPGAVLPFAACYLAAALAVPFGLIAVSRPAGRRAVEASAALRATVLDGIDGHQDLVLFERVPKSADNAIAEASRLAAARQHLGTLGACASAVVQLLGAAALIAALLAGLEALAEHRIEGPLLAGILLATVASFEASAMLVRGATRLAGAAAAAERLKSLSEEAPAVAAAARPSPVPASSSLSFANVTFGFDPARPAVTDLSLVLEPGDCVALTGPSGAGKSTIAQLALRLCDPQLGFVRLNGTDLRAIAATDLSRHIVMMTQDAPIFLDTVRDNLLIGRPSADDAALWDVLAAVRLRDFVATLPLGLDTMLGEAGQTLSTGQGRRLCLARTLLSPARIVVLDEPTSGLDRNAEQAFLEDLAGIAVGRTMLVITHAALPPGAVDRVLRLRAGRLVGTRIVHSSSVHPIRNAIHALL